MPQYTSSGSLLIHYGSPVITENNVIIFPVKTRATDSFVIEARDATTGALVGAVSLLALAPNPVRAEANELRVAKQFGLGYLQFVMMDDMKLVEKHAKAAGLGDVKVSWNTFRSSDVMNDALISGTVDTISAMSRRQILSFYQRRYVPPAMVVAAAGSLDHGVVVRLVREAFAGRFATGGVAPQPRRSSESSPRLRRGRLAVQDGADVARVEVGTGCVLPARRACSLDSCLRRNDEVAGCGGRRCAGMTR